MLDEAEAIEALALYGIDTPCYAVALSPKKAGRLSDVIGYPIVLKGRGISHKTESGNIRSGLNSFCKVNVAARAMNSNTFLVEEMVDGLVCELMLGVIRDLVDGFILTLAAGGVMTKLM